jgi:hypothetical protein
MFSVFAIGPKVRVFKPGQGNGYLSVVKSAHTLSFIWEAKLSAPCKILPHVKNPSKYE